MQSMTERWVDIAIGGWLIVSPWILGFSDEVLVKWSCVLCGIVLVAVNGWIIAERRYGESK